jgi:crotonobetainyl-CoA:carnitine CoA-transferase CaiB-like acyl-CoA transferase
MTPVRELQRSSRSEARNGKTVDRGSIPYGRKTRAGGNSAQRLVGCNSESDGKMTTRGKASVSAGPLDGVRVLELTHYAVGPYAGFLLGVLGADVVKIENPTGGDPLRGWGGEMVESGDPSLFFRACNSGKASVALSISGAGGAEAVKALLSKFDVFITNLNAEVLERNGLSGRDCLAVNPELIYVAVTGFGSKGPLAQRPAFDTIAQAITGLLDVYMSTGPVPDNAPAIADLTGGLTAAAGAMAGLISRQRTGHGMVIETSLLESMVTILAGSQINTNVPDASSQSRSAKSQMFQPRTADDRYLAIHLSTSDKYWNRLVAALDLPDLGTDPRFLTYQSRAANYSDLVDILGVCFARNSSDEWEARLAEANIPFAKVVTLNESMTHPQVAALELFEYDDVGRGVLFRGPWQINGERPAVVDHVAALGADSVSVLSEVLTAPEIVELRAAGVVRDPGK